MLELWVLELWVLELWCWSGGSSVSADAEASGHPARHRVRGGPGPRVAG